MVSDFSKIYAAFLELDGLDYFASRSLYFFKKSKLGGQANEEIGNKAGIVD